MVRKSLLLFSVISGLLLSLPWISASFSWVLFVAFVPLLYVADQLADQKQSHSSIAVFFYSSVTFILWNVLSTWWIAYVSFSGMLLISVLNAFLMASVWWLMHLVNQKLNVRTGYFSLVVFWLTFEFFHFHWSFQWPWLTLGNGFANSVRMVQWYDFTGVLGGSFWILLTNILFFSIYKNIAKRKYLKSFNLSIWVLLLIILPVGWSLYRYYTFSERGKPIEVVVLQPNIDPYSDKFSGMSTEKQVQRLFLLAETTVSDSTDFILAPETSLPTMWEDSLLHENQLLQFIFRTIRKSKKTSFIAGAITQRKFKIGETVSKTARRSANCSFYYDIYNSALMIDSTSYVQIGHKSILVSGVEKMPFQNYLSFLEKYVIHLGGVGGSFASADQSTVFDVTDKNKIGSVICFESAFGEFVGSTVTKGANLIFVMTNDGWWKDSPGVSQHFSYSRLRAIETRRNIVRCANTGISGFINERGDVLKKTDVNSCVAISAKIRMNDTITFYVRYGDFIGRISMILSGLILGYLLKGWLKNRG
jgi:apolipoprotein N-acyltransferase